MALDYLQHAINYLEIMEKAIIRVACEQCDWVKKIRLTLKPLYF